jgi:hypothetical protein
MSHQQQQWRSDPSKLSSAARGAVLDSLQHQQQQQRSSSSTTPSSSSSSSNKSTMYNYNIEADNIRGQEFILTRILLRLAAVLSEAGEISLEEKIKMKNLIVSHDQALFRAARNFDQRRDLAVFRDTLHGLLNV